MTTLIALMTMTTYVQCVSGGRLWFSMSASGTIAEVFFPPTEMPKILVKTAKRAQ